MRFASAGLLHQRSDEEIKVAHHGGFILRLQPAGGINVGQSGTHSIGVVGVMHRRVVGALRAAHQLGLRVPEQFGIISCDNTPLTELAETPITSVDVDTFALGVQAAQILIEQIEDPQTSLRQILLSTKLIERASTMRETREETEAIHI